MWNFGLLRLLETDRAQLSKSGNVRRDQQFARTLPIGENSSVGRPLGRLRGYSAWCTLIPL